MPFYHKLGEVPPKRHVAFRRDDHKLYYEHLMGNLGFTGLQSLLYTHRRPTTVVSVEKAWESSWQRDPDETLRRWHILKKAASQAIIANGGTISHQHGVGTDHAPYLQAEKGALGMAALGDVLRRFDPYEVMNPGKLI